MGPLPAMKTSVKTISGKMPRVSAPLLRTSQILSWVYRTGMLGWLIVPRQVEAEGKDRRLQGDEECNNPKIHPIFYRFLARLVVYQGSRHIIVYRRYVGEFVP